MEKAILADAKKRGGSAHIVVLGDFTDRGLGVRQIIDRLLARLPPSGITRIVLSGNHEAMMVDFLDNPDIDHGWLRFGGTRNAPVLRHRLHEVEKGQGKRRGHRPR